MQYAKAMGDASEQTPKRRGRPAKASSQSINDAREVEQPMAPASRPPTTNINTESMNRQKSSPANVTLSLPPQKLQEIASNQSKNVATTNTANPAKTTQVEPAPVARMSVDHGASWSQQPDGQKTSSAQSARLAAATSLASTVSVPASSAEQAHDILDGLSFQTSREFKVMLDKAYIVRAIGSGEGLVPVDILFHVKQKKEEDIKKLDGEVQSAQTQVQELQKQLEELETARQAIPQLQQRVASQDQQLLEARIMLGQESKAKETSLNQAIKERDDIAGSYELLVQKNDNCTTENAAFAKELETLKHDKRLLQELVASAQTAEGKQKEISQKHEKTISKLKKDLQTANDTLIIAEKSVCNLEAELAEAKSTERQAIEALNFLWVEDQTKCVELNSKVAELSTELEDERSRINTLQKDDGVLRNTIKDCYRRVANDDCDNRREDLSSSRMLKDIATKLDNMTSRVSGTAEEYETLKATQAREVERLTNNITELNHQLATIKAQSQCNDRTSTDAHVEKHVSHIASPEVVQLRQDNHKLEGELRSTNQTLEVNKSRTLQLESKVAELITQSQALMSYNLTRADDKTKLSNVVIEVQNRRNIAHKLLEPLEASTGMSDARTGALESSPQASHITTDSNEHFQHENHQLNIQNVRKYASQLSNTRTESQGKMAEVGAATIALQVQPHVSTPTTPSVDTPGKKLTFHIPTSRTAAAPATSLKRKERDSCLAPPTSRGGSHRSEYDNNHAHKKRAYGDSRSPPAQIVDDYCKHWVLTGTCDYMWERGYCKFTKHEMPADPRTRLRLTNSADYPPWWVKQKGERR